MGRRTYANMRQAMVYTLAVHVPIAGLAMLPILFGLPLLLAPLHIAFLELVIDPACSLVFEAEEGPDNLMSIPPRSADETLLASGQVMHSLVYGSLTTLVVFLLYQRMLGLFDPGIARAVAFVMLVTANAVLILPARHADRSGKRILSRVTPTTLWVVAATVTALWLVTCWAPLAAAFRFERLSTLLWIAGVAGGLVMLPVFELTKYLIKPARLR